MNTEEKIMLMFTALYGEYSGSYSAEIVYDDSYEPSGVQITNEEGYSCGFYSKLGSKLYFHKLSIIVSIVS